MAMCSLPEQQPQSIAVPPAQASSSWPACSQSCQWSLDSSHYCEWQVDFPGLFPGGNLTHTVLQGSLAETVSISNLGVAKTGPVVEESGSLLLEYVNGSACTTSDGRLTTYSTRIHLVCGRGSLVSAG